MNVFILKSKELGSLFKVHPFYKGSDDGKTRELTGYILTTGDAPTTFNDEAEANQWKDFILPKMYKDKGELEAAQKDIIPVPYKLEEDSFQTRVFKWIKKCFNKDIVFNIKERNYRFLEEALELVQACDLSKEEALQLVDYVYSRQKGETIQEVGGVIVTLACLCEVQEINMAKAGEDELSRINKKEVIYLIREKQKSKPH